MNRSILAAAMFLSLIVSWPVVAQTQGSESGWEILIREDPGVGNDVWSTRSPAWLLTAA